jgi:hypothetical protein
MVPVRAGSVYSKSGAAAIEVATIASSAGLARPVRASTPSWAPSKVRSSLSIITDSS